MRWTAADIDWETCAVPDCLGVGYQGEHCVRHQPEEVLSRALQGLQRGEDCDWTRGMVIDERLMEQIREAVPEDAEGRRTYPRMNFNYAQFTSSAQFGRSKFTGSAVFGRCTFERSADFGATIFEHNCGFGETEFKDRAFFKQARFLKFSTFDRCIFRDMASFNVAEGDRVRFEGSEFEGLAYFTGEWVECDLSKCQFKREADFRLECGICSLASSSFTHPGHKGLIACADSLTLGNAEFRETFLLRLSARTIRGDVRTYSSGHIEFRGDLDLKDAKFGGPMLLTRLPDAILGDLAPNTPAPGPTARILSVDQADLRSVTLSEVDLTACIVGGPHGLDQTKVDASVAWPRTPDARWMTRRKVIADEILWRAGQSDTKWEPLAASIRESSRGVLGSEIRRNLLPPGPPPIKIAGTYRSLRKGREDEKDAAGAADFYYGEMEMRRKAAGLRTVEGWLITAYWLFSGYALRAWRAFAVLALLVALCALVFTAWGFDRSPKEGGIGKVDLHTGQVTYTPELPSTGIWAGVVYGAQSATSLLRAPEAKDLTPVGEAIEAFLRVFGPTLVAFGVLALRGRVKR